MIKDHCVQQCHYATYAVCLEKSPRHCYLTTKYSSLRFNNRQLREKSVSQYCPVTPERQERPFIAPLQPEHCSQVHLWQDYLEPHSNFASNKQTSFTTLQHGITKKNKQKTMQVLTVRMKHFRDKSNSRWLIRIFFCEFYCKFESSWGWKRYK